MPWQQLVADVAGELDPATGRLAYLEVIVSVMRQSGKTSWVLAAECDRCLSWPGPQRVVYTAQTGWDARRKLIDDQVPLIEGSRLASATSRIIRGAGNESVIWKNGSRIDLTASTSGAGHGRTLDLAVIDEPWADPDDRREQALLPAMITRPDAQLLVTSTAGTDASVYLRRKVEAGRDAATADRGSGVCYFEWSIPEDEDIDDPDVWQTHMPAFGWTVTEERVAHARQSMSEPEFRRAFGNQWVTTDVDRVIPQNLWDAVVDPAAAPEPPLVYGLDVSPNGESSAIVAAGGGSVELIEHEPRADWVVSRLSALVKSWGGRVLVDGGGPGAFLADDLEDEKVPVERLNTAALAASCQRFYNAVADRQIRIRPHPSFEQAVAGLGKRPHNDRFIWSRSASSTDITPLMAATIAYGARSEVDRPPRIHVYQPKES